MSPSADKSTKIENPLTETRQLKYGVDFVNSNQNIAGTITPHHMLLTKDDVFKNKEINPHHYCMPVVKNENVSSVNLVGPICETGDFIAKNINIAASAGDLLAVRTVGAYGFVMSSNYNSRPRAAEIIVDKDKFYLIRKREDYSSLTALEEGLDDQI